MQTHEISLRLEFVINIEDGNLITAFPCIMRQCILGRSEQRDFLFLSFLSKLDALNDVLLFLSCNAITTA